MGVCIASVDSTDHSVFILLPRSLVARNNPPSLLCRTINMLTILCYRQLEDQYGTVSRGSAIAHTGNEELVL